MPWVDLPQYSKRKCHFCDKKHHFEKRRKSHRPSKRPYFVENQQLTLRRIISGFVPYHHAPKRPFPNTPKKRILGFRCIKEVVMKKLIAVAMCSLFAGCIEPQEIKVVLPAQKNPQHSASVFDNNLDWISVKSVKVFSIDDKKTEIDFIAISSNQDIERALKEDVLHWITDSIFIHQSNQELLIREYRRDAPKFYEYPRGKYALEFIPNSDK